MDVHCPSIHEQELRGNLVRAGGRDGAAGGAGGAGRALALLSMSSITAC